MISYQVEQWSDIIWSEVEPLLMRHYDEIALDKDKIKFAPHFEVYNALQAVGGLHIVTVRNDGKIVGYHASLVRPHMHYRYCLCAHTDIFWIDPEFRKGGIGIKLFREVENTLRARGVQKIFTACKLGLDLGPIFERLGFKEIERHYSKWIGSE